MAIAFWVLDRWSTGRTLPRWIWPASYFCTAAVAVVAIGTMVMAGDSGARLVWEQLGAFVTAH